ncbi:small GTP-binding protein [Cyanobacterium stanieri PCC 7202]|uniref:Small GTP-binding protein n=1 Tax=Cyanobacterium stanieri (strain ATCC 29140 / PCC 7202) TaxID=292563 RepID=K9YMS3_CYASC|nr:small GTP-binding protein [Cyanobacterium stanieri PCC 7202]
MRLSRLLTIVVGLSIIFGLMLWLVSALSRLYSEISWTSPLLANFLIFVLILLLIFFIVIFLYYFGIIPSDKTNPSNRGKSKRKRPLPALPAQKNEIASETIKAVKKQVAQIQDEVTQKALLEKSRQIEVNFSTGTLKVAVFGTGSAGKTSLVNALMGEMVGEIQASIGTTTEGVTHSLKIPSANREILITDTPGILEMGAPGEIREQLARELATEADLLLFVCDNDLRASEFKPLEALATIGKRSLLIFNKVDLYSEQEQEVILNNLQQRVAKFIPSNDVIKACANPQPVQFSADEIIQPEVEVSNVIKRLAAICRAEGDDLLADNILLQSQRLGEEARKLIAQQRTREADKIISRYQWIGAGVIACTPVPVVDMLAAAAVNAQMVVEIGQVYGCEINSDRGRDLAVSLGKTLVSLGVVKGAVELVARALQLTLATYVVGKAIQGVSAAYLTRIAGKSFVEYFSHDQDWGDGGITEVVQRQFKLSRKDEFIKAFVQDAIARVIEPIKDTLEENFEEEDYQEESNAVYFDDDEWGESINNKSNDWW